ncbi:MAG: flagellar biosynthesis anti-sigma factor FlgM [Lachnospiraceae bacterium]|nr:flagellar biosynthesis anti-sigma factor FlgM [Lachnospiraceae bacterium]
MRIEAYNNVNQIYKPKSVGKPGSVSKTSYQPDQLSISSFGKDLQSVRAAVASASDIREDKVAPLKASIAQGTYNVDNGDFASKLIEKYQEKYVF